MVHHKESSLKVSTIRMVSQCSLLQLLVRHDLACWQCCPQSSWLVCTCQVFRALNPHQRHGA